MKDELKLYYSQNTLTNEQKAALSTQMRETVEKMSAKNSAVHKLSFVITHKSRILQAAAVIAFGFLSIGIFSAIKNDTFRLEYPDNASVSVPLAESTPDNKYNSFYYYDPQFSSSSKAEFNQSEEFLFKYDGFSYYLNNQRSSKINFVFDNGETYTLRKVIDNEIIPINILVYSEFLVCTAKNSETGEIIEINQNRMDFLLESNGKLRIEEGYLIKK